MIQSKRHRNQHSKWNHQVELLFCPHASWSDRVFESEFRNLISLLEFGGKDTNATSNVNFIQFLLLWFRCLIVWLMIQRAIFNTAIKLYWCMKFLLYNIACLKKTDSEKKVNESLNEWLNHPQDFMQVTFNLCKRLFWAAQHFKATFVQKISSKVLEGNVLQKRLKKVGGKYRI